MATKGDVASVRSDLAHLEDRFDRLEDRFNSMSDSMREQLKTDTLTTVASMTALTVIFSLIVSLIR